MAVIVTPRHAYVLQLLLYSLLLLKNVENCNFIDATNILDKNSDKLKYFYIEILESKNLTMIFVLFLSFYFFSCFLFCSVLKFTGW
jgi:hypothetical protein